MTPARRLRHSRGFTLIEVMTVVGILAVVVALATPSMLRMYRTSAVGGAVRDLYGGFLEAQSLARTTGSAHCLYLDRVNKLWRVRELGTGCDGAVKREKRLEPGHVAFKADGYGASFPNGPYASMPSDKWCTACGDDDGYLQFDSDGLVKAATGNYASGSISLYDSASSNGSVEAMVFVGRTGALRLFRR